MNLQGQNCVAFIQRTGDATKEDINRLLRIDTKADRQCSICLENANKPHELKCSHTFCSECVAAWLARNQECPVCRA